MKRIETTCCIVGGGPAGAVLSYMLARKGVDVILIEAQKDFAREFRGDTIHPSVMENMEELGLAEEILKLPHVKVRQLYFNSGNTKTLVTDLGLLNTKYPYITLMPQERFLEWMTGKAKTFPNFKLMMETKAEKVIEENGKIQGVICHTPEGEVEIRAHLTVATDGRYSTVRKEAGMEVMKTAVPMDVFWFKLSKSPQDGQIEGVSGNINKGTIFAQIDRGDYWQMGIVVPKGSYQKIHQAGIEGFQKTFAEVAPHFKDRVKEIKNWHDIGYFMIECGRVKQWYKDGLLLIGDAAHIMSPVGGIGINYVIQDAIEAANVLTKPLLKKSVTTEDLAKVQKKRLWTTKLIQWFQHQAHQRIVAQALKQKEGFQAPWFAKLPGMRKLLAYTIGLGFGRAHVDQD